MLGWQNFTTILRGMKMYEVKELTALAKFAEQAKRYEDMSEYMVRVVQSQKILNNEERNLLSVAFTNVVGSYQTPLRALTSISEKESSQGSPYVPILDEYIGKIGSQLQQYCEEIINLLDTILLLSDATPESQIFYLTMKGDCYHYIAEYSSGEDKSMAAGNAKNSYEQATEKATASLTTTHHLRLSLALNYATFKYEVMNDPEAACSIGKTAFDQAISNLDQLDDESYKLSTTILQLIRENLTLWNK
jgi:14-3-3 protein epsilon